MAIVPCGLEVVRTYGRHTFGFESNLHEHLINVTGRGSNRFHISSMVKWYELLRKTLHVWTLGHGTGSSEPSYKLGLVGTQRLVHTALAFYRTTLLEIILA